MTYFSKSLIWEQTEVKGEDGDFYKAKTERIYGLDRISKLRISATILNGGRSFNLEIYFQLVLCEVPPVSTKTMP